jgi:4-hydroxybenzoate polyprenyltransferase
MLPAVIESLRPKQWTKNLLVFGALFFVPGALLMPDLVFRTLLAFVLFSLASGAGYLINDIRDCEYDMAHPKKCLRPIASGRLKASAAYVWAAVLVLIAVAGGVYLDLTNVVLPPAATPLHEIPYAFVATIISYIILTLIYSIWLRKVPLLDVLVLSAGFALRAVAGAVALKVIISPWLLLCTGLLALYLALGKRRQELIRLGIPDNGTGGRDGCVGRSSLEGYSVPLLDQLLIIAASVNLMSYSLYTFRASGHPDDRLMLTIPFVVYGVFRYHWLLHNLEVGEAPDEVLLSDRPLLICVLLWALFVAVLLLLP